MDKKVALCSIGRLENQYAVEFVEWYNKLGFDKIFIYDNNHGDEEHFEDVLQQYINDGLVEITDFRDKEAAQLSAYNDCYEKHGKEYDWIAFFDFDEFLTLVSDKDIKSYISRFSEECQCILLNWMIMTDNGQVYNTHRPLQERFTEPMDYDKCIGYSFSENNHVKSIVKGGINGLTFGSTPHVPSTSLRCCDSLGHMVTQSPFVNYEFGGAYIKHYQFKTVEEWLTNKMMRGTADRSYEQFINSTDVNHFFKVNEKTEYKTEYIEGNVKQKVIVSMTTILGRMNRLLQNLPYILNQSYHYDKLIINVDDNLTKEDYEWYENLKDRDSRIEINKSEAKWRSCNKLIPTLKKYPHDVIITLDDDVAYPIDTISQLMEWHEKHLECIIAHEINPIVLNSKYVVSGDNVVSNEYVSYLNNYDVMLMQVEWGKYLSNCALFPPYSFDDDIYDYDKMIQCTDGTHDELWFWINSTIHGVQCIGLNYVRSFAPEMLAQYGEGEYNLSTVNNSNEKIADYMGRINNMYGDRLLDNIYSKPCVFTINKDNIYSFFFLYNYIKQIYPVAVYKMEGLTNGWKIKLINLINEKEKESV